MLEFQLGEDEASFLSRRAAEERHNMAESACMVRTAHEDLAESYEERLHVLCEADAELRALVDRIR